MSDPRILIVPPCKRTAGKHIARIAAAGGIRLDATQQMLAGVIGGETRDRRWAAFEAVVFCPRQNLKTELLIARILAGLYLFNEELILFSAHQARTTAEVFRRVRRAIEGSPLLGARITRTSNRSGAETIELATGQRLQCVARSTSTGRGYVGDAVLFDEAHDLDSEELAAVLPMLSTRKNPQVVYALSFGDESSTHLGGLRARALAREPGIAWAEWSMGEGDDIADRQVWRACNPAVEAGRITMEYLEREYASLGPELFAKERLGRSNWPADETGRFAVISREHWDRCADPVIAPPDVGQLYPVSLGVAVDRAGRSGAVVACGVLDGAHVLEVTDWRPGEGAAWVGTRLRELTRRHEVSSAAWDEKSMAGPLGLASYLPDEVQAVTPRPGELAEACAAFFYATEQHTIRHRRDERLTRAAGAALMRPVSGTWVWRDDTRGAEVIQAATWALHAAGVEACEPGAWMIDLGGPPRLTFEQVAAWQPSGMPGEIPPTAWDEWPPRFP